MIGSVLAIDPGLSKCGVAVVSRDEGVLVRMVVGTSQLKEALQRLENEFNPQTVIIGSGTGSRRIAEMADALTAPVCLVDERCSTQDARWRYFKENPPKGLRRLIPRGMLLPPEPYDDYAAILLAEAFLAADS